MACYDEVPFSKRMEDEGSYKPDAGPRVQRDGNNVREIAANTEDFALHVRPRRMIQRDADWRTGE